MTHLHEHSAHPKLYADLQPSDSAHARRSVANYLDHPVKYSTAMAKPKTVAQLDRFKTRYQTLLRKTGIENARIERTCVCKFSAFPFPQQMNSAAATLLSMRTSALTYIISLNV